MLSDLGVWLSKFLVRILIEAGVIKIVVRSGLDRGNGSHESKQARKCPAQIVFDDEAVR